MTLAVALIAVGYVAVTVIFWPWGLLASAAHAVLLALFAKLKK